MKGGFAVCYKVTKETGELFAAKIITKESLKTTRNKEMLRGEIKIHSLLQHPNVVKFYEFIEDDANIYIILELCPNYSLMTMLKKRKTLTEPEVKYFLTQIIGGVMYMHSRGVIHRDLKLGNIFLSNDVSVKIGDFGLAAMLTSKHDRKKSVCGTPNYIAPEILYGRDYGHSYEADAWSIGIIFYTMVFGKPPFQSKEVEGIYQKIKLGRYEMPNEIGSLDAKLLITALLNTDPTKRLELKPALEFDFFKTNFPPAIDESCLENTPEDYTTSPEESATNFTNCKIASQIEQAPVKVLATPSQSKHMSGRLNNHSQEIQETRYNRAKRKNFASASSLSTAWPTFRKPSPNKLDGLYYIYEATRHVYSFLVTGKESGDSRSHRGVYGPLIYVTKWVDYSNKHGIAYQLSNDVTGILLNDGTVIQTKGTLDKFCLLNWSYDEKEWHSWDCPKLEECTSEQFTNIRLVRALHRYMNESLRESGSAPRTTTESLVDTTWLVHFFRADDVVILLTGRCTIQFNFADHTKIIMQYHPSTSRNSVQITFIDSLQHLHNCLLFEPGALPAMAGFTAKEIEVKLTKCWRVLYDLIKQTEAEQSV